MAIFAKSGDKIISPDIMFYDGSLLTSKTYTVPRAAMKEMGFNTGAIQAPGGQFGSEILFNCPFGRDNIESRKCRMTVKFNEPIDTLAILYGIVQVSNLWGGSLYSSSETDPRKPSIVTSNNTPCCRLLNMCRNLEMTPMQQCSFRSFPSSAAVAVPTIPPLLRAWFQSQDRMASASRVSLPDLVSSVMSLEANSVRVR